MFDKHLRKGCEMCVRGSANSEIFFFQRKSKYTTSEEENRNEVEKMCSDGWTVITHKPAGRGGREGRAGRMREEE